MDEKIENQNYINLQESDRDNLINKRGIVTGLFYSFLTAVIVYFFSYFVFVFLFGQYLGMFLVGIIDKMPSFLVAVLILIPFLFFNSLVFLASKNKSHKRGLLFGYFFAVLFFISSFLYINSIYSDISQFNADGEKASTVMEQGNESTCISINDQYQQDYCWKNLSMCEKISSDSFWQLPCYKSVASKDNNYSYCEKLQNTGEKMDCLNYVAQITKNPAICDLIDFDILYHFKYNSSSQIVDTSIVRDSCYWYSIPGAFSGNRPVDLMKKYCPLFKYKRFNDECSLFFRNNP